MSTHQVMAGFDRSWFALDGQRRPLDLEQFLGGIEILIHNPHLAQIQYPLVEHVLLQLRPEDLRTGRRQNG